MTLYSGDYPKNTWYALLSSDTRSAAHELGHTAGLPELLGGHNLMTQGRKNTNLTNGQRMIMPGNAKRGILNFGRNYEMSPLGNKIPVPWTIETNVFGRPKRDRLGNIIKCDLRNYGLYLK